MHPIDAINIVFAKDALGAAIINGIPLAGTIFGYKVGVNHAVWEVYDPLSGNTVLSRRPSMGARLKQAPSIEAELELIECPRWAANTSLAAISSGDACISMVIRSVDCCGPDRYTASLFLPLPAFDWPEKYAGQNGG